MSYLPSHDIDDILEQCGDIWRLFKNQSVFLTGGTGFVGTWLAESFLAANERFNLRARLVVLSRDPATFKRRAVGLSGAEALEFIHGSCSDFTFPSGQFCFVIHAATEQGRAPSVQFPSGPLEENILGTRRVLEFARACGARRVLLTSSGAVYGRQPAEVALVPEDYSGAPVTWDLGSAYGESKRVSEYLAISYGRAFGFDALIARLFAFVGPLLPLDLNFAVGNFIRDSIAGGPIKVAGDGTPLRSYLYAADLAIWLWKILATGQHARPYNVGSSDAISIADLARLVGRHTRLASEFEVSIARQSDPSAPIARYVPCTKRARDELGLAVRVSLAEGIRRTVLWNAPQVGVQR